MNTSHFVRAPPHSPFIRDRARVQVGGYIGHMSQAAPEISRCPAELCVDALTLMLCDLAPSERREIAKSICNSNEADLSDEPLFVARRNGTLCGAAWGQRQPGNYAIFWSPQLATSEPGQTAARLAEAVISALDALGVDLVQSLLADASDERATVLQHVGFQHSADLLYLNCESARFPLASPAPCELEFTEYTESERNRLERLVERTYENTKDCTALDGVRNIGDVIRGYQATGVFRPQNWLFVRHQGQDVGALLLADHYPVRHWELIYMGLLPPYRGRGWGRRIAQYAQWLARIANVDRILVAVDALNQPAINVYRNTGFQIWDRRAVFLRFPPRKNG